MLNRACFLVAKVSRQLKVEGITYPLQRLFAIQVFETAHVSKKYNTAPFWEASTRLGKLHSSSVQLLSFRPTQAVQLQLVRHYSITPRRKTIEQEEFEAEFNEEEFEDGEYDDFEEFEEFEVDEDGEFEFDDDPDNEEEEEADDAQSPSKTRQGAFVG